MDISDIKAGERTIEIVHPKTKEELGIKVHLVSLDDDRVAKTRRKILNRKLQLQSKGKNVKAEEIEENNSEFVFSAMTGWEWNGDATFRGSKPEFTKDKVFEVFKSLPWFEEQIDAALGDETAFY